jgi:hypothetical protein
MKELTVAVGQHPGRLFVCFHKRYAVYNSLALNDLNVQPGQPIDYHCIVFEVPLPQRHWYRWPSSRSRVVSNGCHWIDHFMFLNDYCPVFRHEIQESKNGTVVILLELENGATFSMTLTDIGSRRIGLRDFTELRSGDAQVRIVDHKAYEAENSHRILRRRRLRVMDSYQRMYRTISQRIVRGEPGDSFESLRSSQVVIDLDEQLHSQLPRSVERPSSLP